MVAYRVWAEGDAAVETTHFANRPEWVAEWYCDAYLQPGGYCYFGEALTVFVECGGVTKKFSVTPEQEITYDIEEVE